MLCLQKGNQILVEEEIKNIVDAPNILVIGHKITSHDGTQINLIRLQHHGEVIQEEASYASNAIKLGILSEIAHSITTGIMTKVNNVAEGGGVALISSTKPTNESCRTSPTTALKHKIPYECLFGRKPVLAWCCISARCMFQIVVVKD
jgi:hypothetical protein